MAVPSFSSMASSATSSAPTESLCDAATLRRVRLVIRRLAEGEHDVELLDQAAANSLHVLAPGSLEKTGPEGRIMESCRPLRRRQRRHLAVDGVGEERIERALEPEQHSNGANRSLAGHGEPIGSGLLDAAQDRSVVVVTAR